jgi:SCY1-like protein 2
MALIKSLSIRIETEQSRKLQDISSNTPTANGSNDFLDFGGSQPQTNNADDIDFESLVLGRTKASTPIDSGWGQTSQTSSRPSVSRSPSNLSGAGTASFAWSSNATSPPPVTTGFSGSSSQNLSSFSTLTPSNTSGFSQPLQPSKPAMLSPTQPSAWGSSTSGSGTPAASTGSSIDWSAAVGGAASNPWGSSTTSSQPVSQTNSWSSYGQSTTPSFTAPQPTSSPYQSFSIAPPPAKPTMQQQSSFSSGGLGGLSMGQQQHNQPQQQQQQQQPAQKQGMAKYESLL